MAEPTHDNDYSRSHVMLRLRSGPGFGQTLAIFALVFTTFVFITSEFIVVGLIPEMATDLDISLAEAGSFVTWFALAAALFGPPMTMLASRCNPRTFLLVAIALFAAGNFLIAAAPHYSVVASARLLQGSLLPAVASIVTLVAIGIAGKQRRTWAISQVNTGVVGATILGVPVGAIIAEYAGWSLSFGALAALGAVSVGLIWHHFPRSVTTTAPSAFGELSLLRQPAFLLHLLVSLVLFAGMFAGYTYIAPLIAALTDLEGELVGWALMGFGIAGAIGNWGTGRLAAQDRLTATIGVAVTLAIAMIALVPAGLHSQLLVGLCVGLWGASHMAAFVVTQVRVIEAGSGAPAFALSLNISACNVGIGLGAMLGGQAELQWGIEAVAYLGGATALLAVAIALTIPVISSDRKTPSLLRRKEAVGPE